MLTERIFCRRPLAGARATVAPYPKGTVMERLLEFLNDQAWWSFRSSAFGEEQTTGTAR
jgi:hypothetical protein